MTALAWVFLVAFVLTVLVAVGHWLENVYLKETLDELIRALKLVMDDDDENLTE